MRILLGGVPFGCDNVGDEAILNCVIGIFRRNFPEAELAVATGAPAATAAKFPVRTLPLFGFDPAIPLSAFRRAVRGFDWYVWAGATGLSDYPAMGAAMLEIAQAARVKTVIWQVGMNNELNPAFFRLGGRWRRLADHLGGAARWEEWLEHRMRTRLRKCVSRCDLVVVRDQSSLIELHRSGDFPAAFYGADSAILQQASPGRLLEPGADGERTIGICVSAQNAMRQTEGMAALLERFHRELGARIVFIPMNPKTDRALMSGIRERLSFAERTVMVEQFEPEDIQNIVGGCDLLISSRLHLLILGLNRLVPGIGIARGSKIANYLTPFGLPTIGTTDDCDFEQLFQESRRLLEDREFAGRARQVREKLLARLAASEARLHEIV